MKIGWGGRIRTFTVLINSEVSYQLDHAPAAWLAPSVAHREFTLATQVQDTLPPMKTAKSPLKDSMTLEDDKLLSEENLNGKYEKSREVKTIWATRHGPIWDDVTKTGVEKSEMGQI